MEWGRGRLKTVAHGCARWLPWRELMTKTSTRVGVVPSKEAATLAVTGPRVLRWSSTGRPGQGPRCQ